MDSDVTADSLSPPENRIAAASERRFGGGALSSFSTLGPQDHGGSGERSCPPLDSFDLSTATDASPGDIGGFLDESRQQMSQGEAGGLTPLSRRTRGSDGPHVEERSEDNRHHDHVRIRRSMSFGLPRAGSGDFDVGGEVPAAASSGGQAHRKRSREDAMTDGYGRGWQQRRNRLESSWPLSRHEVPSRRSRSSAGGGSQLGQSNTSPSPRLSRQGATDGSPHGHYETPVPRSSFGRGGRESIDRGSEGCYTSRGEHDNSGSAGDSISIGGSDGGMHNSMGGIMRPSGNGLSWNGSTSENLSISEESSRGLPAPPIVTSGPLPAIGALREHFLTQKQQHSLDRERRLAADHMRRINQVLAGHLSFSEVARVHEHQDSFDALSAAPSHGSTVHYSPRESPLDDGDDEKINAERFSARQAALRQLVVRVARDRTRNALAWAWIRFWRQPSRRHTHSVARATAPSFGETPGGVERVEDRPGHQRECSAQDRQQQASKLVYRLCRDRNRRLLFRGWSRLCQHAVSATRPVTSFKAETTVANEDRPFKNSTDSPAKIVRGVGGDPPRKVEISSLERRVQIVKHLVTRIHDAQNRRLLYRGWSRFLLHAATISAVEAYRATTTATTNVAATAVGKAQREQAGRSGTEVATAASASDRAPRKTSNPSEEAMKLRARLEETERVRQGSAIRSLSRLVYRACKDRDRRLLFRAWNRLCLHAASRDATGVQWATGASKAKAATLKAKENEAIAATTAINVPPNNDVIQEQAETAAQRAREQRQKCAVQLMAYLCRDSDRRFLFRGWNRLCLHAASLHIAEEAFPAAAAAAAAARAGRAEITDSEEAVAVDESETSKQAVAAAKAARVMATMPTEQDLYQATTASEESGELPPLREEEERTRRDRRNRALGLVVGRRRREQDRRHLFRGWNRLYLHAATLAVAEKASALVVATATASGVSTTSALDSAANLEVNGSRREANSERNGGEAGSRSRSSGHRLREQRIIRGSLKIDQIFQDKDRRSLTRGWSRLLLYIPSQGALEATSLTAIAATRPDDTSGEAKKVTATPSSAELATSVAALRQRAQLAEKEAREHQEKLGLQLMVRVCSERDKRSLFRSWNRLCLHAASSKADEATRDVDTATARVTTVDRMEERGETATVQQDGDATEKLGGASVGETKLLERAHEAERALDEQKRRQAGRLIARTLGDRDRRKIARGFHRLCLHAASVSAAERVVAATSLAVATIGADVTKGEATASDGRVGASNPAVAGAAPATEDTLRAGAGGDDTAMVTRVRAEKAEEALRRQGGRLIARILEGRNRRRYARGWSRLYLHNPSPDALEGSSASTTVAARIIRAETVDNKEPVAAEENETRQRAQNTGIAKKGSVAAREEAKRAVARASVMAAALKRREDELEQLVQAQRKHRAIMVITRVCRDRDRPLLALGWSRLCLRAVEDASTVGVTVAAPTRGQAGEAAVVDRKFEHVRYGTAPAAANEQPQEEADSSSGFAVNIRHRRPNNEKGETRAQQERRAKRLIERLCVDKERTLLFRGWSRLCMHAAAAARAPLVDAKETDEAGDALKAEVCGTGAGASMDAVAATETIQQEAADTSELVSKLKKNDAKLQHLLREQHLRRIIRARHDRDRSLLFRGWSRLCLHAWSFNAAAGASAAATDSLGGVRAQGIDGKENLAVGEANASQKGAATSDSLDGVQEEKGRGNQEALSIHRAAADYCQIPGIPEQEVRKQQKRAAKMIARVGRDRDKALLFRGWSRLCLHAASLSAVEGASAAAASTARVARAEAMEMEATAATEKAVAWKRAAAASADVAAAKEQAARETAVGSTSAAELEQQEEFAARGLRQGRERRAKMLIARIVRDRDRALVFRGWSRLCLHAASVSVAEGASAAATAAARAARAEAMEAEATAAVERAKALRRAAVESADVAASREQEKREEDQALTLTAELERREEAICEVLQKQRERRAKMMIVRVGRERDRALVFRGWSRLCLHAASLSAAEGASATATAVARTTRAEAMEMEATAAAQRAEACHASADVAVSREQTKREATELEGRGEAMDQVLQEQRQRRMKMLIARVGRDRDRTLMFRGWSRLCLHAASLSAAEGASAAATAAARAARADAMEMEATAATKKAEACLASAGVAASREHTKREAAELGKREEAADKVLQEQRERHAKLMITRVGRDRDRALVFRGWTRLCLHAASLSASEGASAAATAAARAARAVAMEMEATATAKKAEGCQASADVAASREQGQRDATRESTSVAELVGREGGMDQVEQKQRQRRAKMLIARVGRDRDRALLFRGWSRLCLHAASFSAAEGTSAAATAAATAARARAMGTEATTAAEKAEALRRAAVASEEVATSKEQVQKDAAEREQRREEMDRQRQERHVKTLISRVGRDRDKALMFRGWSRLCLHAASLSAAEGASAAATAAARAARADAVETEATAAAEKAEAMKRGAAASADMAASREQAQRGAAELARREEATDQALRQQREHLAKTLIARIGRDRDRALMFRGWSRLCLHAASISAAEGASAATTAVARAARAEAMETEATAAAEKAEAMTRAAATSAEAAASKEQAQRGMAELARREEVADQALRPQRERRAKTLIARIARDKDRALMFRGWSRLCMHAASLSAAEGASASATAAARSARAKAVEMEAIAAAKKAEAMKRAAAVSKEVAESKEQAQRGAIELARREEVTIQALQRQRGRLATTLIVRVGRDRDRALMFRGWSRLCLHAASLSAAEGASAAATAAARAARAEAMETEAAVAAEKAAASVRAATASEKMVASREQTQQEATEREQQGEAMDQVLRQQQKRGVKTLITRSGRDKDRALMFRGWSRLCLHAASISAAEGVSASATVAARATRAEAAEPEATAAAEKAEAMKRAATACAEVATSKEQAQQRETKLALREEAMGKALRRQQERGAKTLIARVCRDRDRALMFRGWSRLCLHAASLSAAEGASAAATAVARAARAEAMETEATAAAEKSKAWKRAASASAEVAASKKQAQRGATELAQREETTGLLLRQQRQRRAKTLIARIGRDRDRALMFRGWSRLCLHAASLLSAEGASAAAPAAARAARAKAMETEAIAAAETAETWKRASAASANAVASREQAQRDAAEWEQRGETVDQIARVGRDRDRALMFRGWSRLCMHAASLSAAEGASAAATAAARAARAKAMETEATAAAEKAEAWKRAAAASADVAASREKGQRDATELARREKALGQADRQQRERLAMMLIARVGRDRDRALMFRGWSRLCLHAASLSAAEGASASVTAAARAARAEAMETEATAAAEKAEAWKRAAAASVDVAAPKEQAQREAAELAQRREAMGQVDRQQRERRAKMLIVRVGRDRDRALMFRGWSRLCLHAASLSAAEGASAAATATARAARAEAMETEATAAAEKAEAWKRAAAASVDVAASKGKTQLQAAELARREEAMGTQNQQERQRRVKLLIVRVGRHRDRALMFRGWSRLCLHAASLSAAEGALAATTAAARAIRAEAMETEATAAAEKAEAWKRAAAASVEVAASREQAQREAAKLEKREDAQDQVGRQQQERRAKMLISRVGRDRDKALLFRGWSRLCLHAASLSAAEGASASATAAARAARAEAMEAEAAAAAEKAEAWKRAATASADVAASREQEQRAVTELAQREEAMGEVDQQQRKRRAKIMITRIGRDKDRALMFRGWSRLCLHAAPLSAAEGVSAAATAVARAARAEAMETEATAAAEKAEALKRAAAASAEMAVSRDQVQQEATELARQEGAMRQKDRQQRERRAKMLIARVGRDRDRALMFRGWSRLCLHAASLSAAEGASAAATAAARAARAEAMETEATTAVEKAEAWKRAAAASADVAAEKEQAEREAVELAQQEESMGQVDQHQRERRAKVMIARVGRDRDRGLMFRGWSRLCLHAASLSAAEGASAAATAAARAARAEAMEAEATAAAEKAEARRIGEDTAAPAEQAQRGSELQGQEEAISQMLREHREHRAKMLIFRVSGDRRKARLFRGWSRLRLHAASFSAAEGALPVATNTTEVIEAGAVEEAATSVTRGGVENTDGDIACRRTTAAVMVQRLTADRNRQSLRRAWRLLCQHMAVDDAVTTTAASSAAAETAASESNADDGGPLAHSESASSTNAAGNNGRLQQLRKMVLRHALRADRRMIARGWARLAAAAAVSASKVAVTEGTKKIEALKAYAVDLQQQAARRRRELERKTRALDILLRGDWANAVLDRVRETRATRLQLANAEADREAQVGAMAGLAVDGKKAGTKNAPGAMGDQDDKRGVDTGTTGNEEGEDGISVEGSGGGVEMVALQEDDAHRLQTYMGAKDRDCKRARVEAQLWRTRCGEMQRRLKSTFTSSGAWPSTSAAERERLPAVLLDMLDEKDRRLTQLHSNLASLATVCDKGGGRAHAKRQAGDFLLRQISAAGEEARTCILRLSHEVQFLETELAELRILNSGQQPFDAVKSYSANGGSHGIDGLAATSLQQFPPQDARVLDDEVANTATTSPSAECYPTVLLDEGVQAATDAHLLVCSLRSEVSALECHRAALEAKLSRLEDVSASTFDETAAAAAAATATATAAAAASAAAATAAATVTTPTAAAMPDTATTKGGSIAATDATENEETPADPGAPSKPTLSEKARRRADRTERKKRAVMVLRQAFLHRDAPMNPVQAHVSAVAEGFRAPEAMLSSMAARAEHTREVRRRAQETFVSARANEVERGLEGSPHGP